MATKYLIERGHREIAIITGYLKKNGVAERRFLGYRKALEEANIEYKADYVYADSVSYDCGVLAGHKITEAPGDITAVFATADLIAAGAVSSFHMAGLRVPEDISIIGFDNLSISNMIYPRLTTVDQKIFQKGVKAADILISVLENKSKEMQKDISMDLAIIERNSVSVRKLNVSSDDSESEVIARKDVR